MTRPKYVPSRAHLRPLLSAVVLLGLIGLTKLVSCQSQPPDSAEDSDVIERIRRQIHDQINRLAEGLNGTHPAAPVNSDSINLVEADDNGLYVVGLFDVHSAIAKSPFKCGPIDLDAGEMQTRRSIQNMVAFQWAIEQVNADKMLLPGVRLGSLLMDTCSSFLRTNQQLANLLHVESHPSPSITPRNLLAIVADNHDWQSVEATISMASALGLTTFVTQSKSTKLTEFARKYLPSDQMDFSQDMRLAEVQAERSLRGSESQMQHQFENFLSNLLGIGRMIPTNPLGAGGSNSSGVLADIQPVDDLASSRAEQQSHSQKLLMVKMLLGNELLAEAISSLVQQMNWDYLSLIYDDSPEMIDLHDEIARQLFAKNIQLAIDEQLKAPTTRVAASNSADCEKLLLNLARKSVSGSRVVISLLGTGSSRSLLECLRKVRQVKTNQELVRQINSLLWITVSDREPYYSFATDALGTIAISSSSSLISEFKSYFDRLASGVDSSNNREGNNASGGRNKWWPEYIRSILVKHRKDGVEIITNECTKWLEPKSSPLNEQCRALTLSSLVQIEKKSSLALNGSIIMSSSGNKNPTKETKSSSARQNGSKLNKYLAGGWEHNGMDVINSVLAVANGLESIRQTLCPESQVGICERMRLLVHQPTRFPSPDAKDLPKLSELIYNELLRSTFQLADGRMFNLDDFNFLGGQVDGKLKLYNLRYLQQNSIGFVKFGHYDQHDGLTLNLTKAKFYPDNNFANQIAIDQVKSTCQDETKCLMPSAMQLSESEHGGRQETGNEKASAGADNNRRPHISEEELAAGVNSLFKLDHPFMWNSTATIASDGRNNNNSSNNGTGSSVVNPHNHHESLAPVLLASKDSHVYTMRSPIGFVVGHHQERESERLFSGGQPRDDEGSTPQVAGGFRGKLGQNSSTSLTPASTSASASRAGRQTFDTIVLLPLHGVEREYQSSGELLSSQVALDGRCSRRLDVGHSFQHLVALAYAQTLVNRLGNWRDSQRSSGPSEHQTNSTSGESRAAGEQQPQIELTTTVIDYCESIELAERKLASVLASSGSNKSLALIDFDANVAENIDHLLVDKNLLHITIGLPKRVHKTSTASAGADSPSASSGNLLSEGLMTKQRQVGKNRLSVSLLPSKSNEIEALVKLIDRLPGAAQNHGQSWKLVHLIYTDHHHYRDEFVRLANEANICVSKLIWIPTPEVADGATLDEQADKTRQLFSHELYDYYGSSKQLSKLDPDSSQDLNVTRVLVVLASENESTNRVILKAATESMLDHYVWLTTHEWLSSIELPAELEATASQSDPSSPRLPVSLIATRLESIETDGFKRYYSQLTPSVHSPIPDHWFDEFWQQQFQCKLPIPGVRGADSNLPPCNPSQHLGLHQIVEDDRVHYIVRAVESLHRAIKELTGAGGGVEADSLANKFRSTFSGSELSQSSPGHSPFGLHIVHRVVPLSGDQYSDPNKRTRSNSRSMADPGPSLETIGLWRNGELTLWVGLGNANKLASQSNNDDVAWNIRVSGSLSRLSSIKSHCYSVKTCGLCNQQIQQTKSIMKQEAAKLGQSESVSEPKAISSIWLTGHQSAHQSNSDPMPTLESIANPTFEVPALDDSNQNSSKKATQDDPIQASASSLFDESTAKLVSERRQADMMATFMQMKRQKETRGPSQFGLMSRTKLASGILVSILSLVGVVSVVVIMTYSYPNTINRRPMRSESLMSISSGSIYGSKMQIVKRSGSPDAVESIESSLNEYFLLTGLLMLYSINIALLLPATGGTCCFRRVGLATAYTMIFGSILVKILVLCRKNSVVKKHNVNKVAVGIRAVPPNPSPMQTHPNESVEESVEVTFESLPNEPQMMDATEDQHSHAAGYQSAYPVTNTDRSIQSPSPVEFTDSVAVSMVSTARPLTSSVVLIIGQLLVSITWLYLQPPEPTLYLNCWFCSSPMRSPVMFLHEQLLSLAYPATILILAWICSVFSYKSASKNSASYRLAVKRLLLTSNSNQINWHRSSQRQEILDFYSRDAKSLIITTTLLLITWSLMALRLISNSKKLLPLSSMTSSQQHHSSIHLDHSSLSSSLMTDDLTLVYTNIISGTVIFSLLYLYKFQLFSRFISSVFCCGGTRERRKLKSLSGAESRNEVLKFNQRSGVNDGWNTHESPAHRERVRLQQFSSSYGTYAAEDHPNTTTRGSPMASSAKGSSKRVRKSVGLAPQLPNVLSQGQGQTNSEMASIQHSSTKLHRRQSSGSNASSTTRLVSSGNFFDQDDSFMELDAISCASSVASSSTSQVHGNDLYPIDCSLQLDGNTSAESQPSSTMTTPTLGRSVSFNRRSIRRSSLSTGNKLSSVCEENELGSSK